MVPNLVKLIGSFSDSHVTIMDHYIEQLPQPPSILNPRGKRLPYSRLYTQLHRLKILKGFKASSTCIVIDSSQGSGNLFWRKSSNQIAPLENVHACDTMLDSERSYITLASPKPPQKHVFRSQTNSNSRTLQPPPAGPRMGGSVHLSQRGQERELVLRFEVAGAEQELPAIVQSSGPAHGLEPDSGATAAEAEGSGTKRQR